MEVSVATTNERNITIKGTLNDIAEFHDALDPYKKRTKAQTKILVNFAKLIAEADRDIGEIVASRFAEIAKARDKVAAKK